MKKGMSRMRNREYEKSLWCEGFVSARKQRSHEKPILSSRDGAYGEGPCALTLPCATG